MTNFSSALAELQETQKIIERFTTSLGIEESSADLPFAQKFFNYYQNFEF